MNQRSAFTTTVELLKLRVPEDNPMLIHIIEMEPRLEPHFSEAKLGRWLGWIQGVACGLNWMTLEEAKEINKSYSNG